MNIPHAYNIESTFLTEEAGPHNGQRVKMGEEASEINSGMKIFDEQRRTIVT